MESSLYASLGDHTQTKIHLLATFLRLRYYCRRKEGRFSYPLKKTNGDEEGENTDPYADSESDTDLVQSGELSDGERSRYGFYRHLASKNQLVHLDILTMAFK
jgi:hypothetical protein